jgi:hypothetical protein
LAPYARWNDYKTTATARLAKDFNSYFSHGYDLVTDGSGVTPEKRHDDRTLGLLAAPE